MAFVNRKLEENEIREYVLKWPDEGQTYRCPGATIDDQNDVRLFFYGNGPANKREPSDYYQFVFDYKGEVYFIELRRELLNKNDVHWYFGSHLGKNKLNSEQLQSLREAMKVYALEGFVVGRAERKQKDPTYIAPNEKVTVHIEF